MRFVVGGILLILLAASVEAAQELSTFIYPSEDELEEAYYRGEIDFNQLVILQELIRFGIDSTQLYLLDEIPNLSFFAPFKKIEQTELSVEQEQGFIAARPGSKVLFGKFGYNYSRLLEDEGDFRYRSSGEIRTKDGLKAAFRLHREYSGLERLVYRKVEYRPKKSVLRGLTVGNYTTRMGLGTIFGYRGKLVEFSDEVDGESVLYPDYGGSNGVNLKLGNKNSNGELVFSQVRDSVHMVSTVGGSFGKSYKKLAPMIIVSATTVKNRVTDNSITDFKYGINLESKYDNGYNRFEITGQDGENSSFGAFVTEGKHLFEEAEINYAGWFYGNRFLDLSGGSKAASISRTSEIDEIEFSYSDKRSGQEGGLLKTLVLLSDDLELSNSLLYAQRDQDVYNFEFLSALEKSVSRNLILRADHLSRIKNRINSGGETQDIFRRSRVEVRYVNPSVYIRSYIGYQSETAENDYLSFFVNAKYKSVSFGELSLWFNLGEFEHNSGQVDYWYGYVQNKIDLTDNIHSLAKLTHSYRRGSTDRHISTVTFGLEADI